MAGRRRGPSGLRRASAGSGRAELVQHRQQGTDLRHQLVLRKVICRRARGPSGILLHAAQQAAAR